MSRLPPATLTPCPRFQGKRVGAEIGEADIRRIGGKPVANLMAVVCTVCGFSELYVNPGELPQFQQAIQQYPESFEF